MNAGSISAPLKFVTNAELLEVLPFGGSKAFDVPEGTELPLPPEKLKAKKKQANIRPILPFASNKATMTNAELLKALPFRNSVSDDIPGEKGLTSSGRNSKTNENK